MTLDQAPHWVCRFARLEHCEGNGGGEPCVQRALCLISDGLDIRGALTEHLIADAFSGLREESQD